VRLDRVVVENFLRVGDGRIVVEIPPSGTTLKSPGGPGLAFDPAASPDEWRLFLGYFLPDSSGTKVRVVRLAPFDF
jgi:hypothetical protein